MAALISEAHARCYFAFEKLIDAIQHPVRDFKDQAPLNDVHEDFDRYKIWAGNVGAAHSGKRYDISLDYRLREASFLKDQVVKLLAALVKRITDAESLVRGARIPFEEHTKEHTKNSDGESSSSSTSEADEEDISPDSPWEISSDSSSASGVSQRAKQLRVDDKEDPVAMGDPETVTNSGSNSHPVIQLGRTPMLEMPRLLESIRFTINCLYRIPIRRPAPLDRLKDKTLLESSCYQHFDVLYMKDKFPGLDPDVATRLGKMITRRRQILSYREVHAKNLNMFRVQPAISAPIASALGSPAMHTHTTPEDVQPGSQVAMSQVASSQFSLRSKATTVQPGEVPIVVAHDDNNPMALYAPSVADSKSSMASSFAGKDLQVEVPPRPMGIGGKELDYFECPYCLITTSINTDHKWK
jgi:hypothetical protein